MVLTAFQFFGLPNSVPGFPNQY